MAIDNAEKRFSALQFGSGIGVVIPDGTLDEQDRAALLALYTGIIAEPPSPGGLLLRRRRRSF
jgi:hypothetical protein